MKSNINLNTTCSMSFRSSSLVESESAEDARFRTMKLILASTLRISSYLQAIEF